MCGLFIRPFPAAAKAFLPICLFFLILQSSGCIAQTQTPQPGVFVPALFDPHNREVAPGAVARKTIRFLTSDDYPPFEFIGPDGNLSGYNIDVARGLCDELKLVCTIQPRRWDNLLDALNANEGDAVIASLKETAEARRKALFTSAYYLTPARFVALARAWPLDERALALSPRSVAIQPAPGQTQRAGRGEDGRREGVRPEDLVKTRIGVEAGTAHEAFLRAFFGGSTVETFPDRAALLGGLREGRIDLAFGDAVSLSIWMNDPKSERCCVFRGGPFLEPSYFGEGVGIAVRPDDEDLRHTLNGALQRLEEHGVLAELYLKYFPFGIY
jgi:polar amino acid transport system substrate-binding protein